MALNFVRPIPRSDATFDCGAPSAANAVMRASPREVTRTRALADDDGESAVRMAWEAGRASLEYEVSHLLLNAARKGNIIAAIYFSKAQLGWTEQPQINAQVGVQIVLPDSSPDQETYMRRIADRGIAVNVVANSEPPTSIKVPYLKRREATR